MQLGLNVRMLTADPATEQVISLSSTDLTRSHLTSTDLT